MTGTAPTTVLLSLDPQQSEALDEIARTTDRDRSTVIGDALNAYVDLHREQIAHIREGLRQAEAGKFASDEEVARIFRLGR